MAGLYILPKHVQQDNQEKEIQETRLLKEAHTLAESRFMNVQIICITVCVSFELFAPTKVTIVKQSNICT